MIYREIFHYIFNDNINSIDKNSGLILLDLIEEDLISLMGVFDYIDSKPMEKEKVVQKKIDRIIKYYDALENLNLLDYFDESKSIKDIIMERLRETLRVYETSKDMYNNYDDDIEISIKKLRDRFDYHDVEKRNPEGRKSAINI